jgi:hypothetical protein
MDKEVGKKVSETTIQHWKKKFNRSINILLQAGIESNDLIDEIKRIENEKNNKDQ